MSMGIFRHLTSLISTSSVDKAVVPGVKTVQQPVASVEIDVVATKPNQIAVRFVLLPHISEKASALAARRTYVFRVPVQANKTAIKDAVEKLYNVRVERVNTLRGEGKPVQRGRISGQRKRWKRALVTLRSGYKLELHQGV